MQTVMRNCFFAMAAVVCGMFCASSFFGAQDNPNRTNSAADAGFKVAGVVVSSTTGTPLKDTRVTLVNTRNRREAVWIITRGDGRFEFQGLAAGKYSLEGARRGYIPAGYEQHEQYSTAIVTGKEFDTQNLTLRLVPMAMLTGRVLDEYGDGVRDARVTLYVESNRSSATRVTNTNFTMTDDQGTFEFTPMAPGKYYLSVNAKPWYAVHPPSLVAVGTANAAVAVDRSLDVAYPATYSGGSTEAEGAEAIAIKGGDHAQIDIHLRPVQALHLIFHFADNGERGFQPPTFQKRSFDALEFAPAEGMQQISPGVFEMSGIPAGRYSVQMHGSPQMAHAEIELKQDGQDLDELGGEPAGRVKVSVKLPKEGPPPQQINVGLQDDQHRMVAFHQLDANGEATFEDLAAGKYGIYLFVPGKTYSVARLTSGATQISGHEFDLLPGTLQEWSVSLAEGKTKIEGLVKRGGKAASGVMVVLVPKDPEIHQDMF